LRHLSGALESLHRIVPTMPDLRECLLPLASIGFSEEWSDLNLLIAESTTVLASSHRWQPGLVSSVSAISLDTG
jgi:hypothetical protein